MLWIFQSAKKDVFSAKHVFSKGTLKRNVKNQLWSCLHVSIFGHKFYVSHFQIIYTGKRPQTVWGVESHVRSCGTGAGQVRHCRKCDRRSSFWHSKQFIRTSYQNLIGAHLGEFQKIVKEGPLSRGSHKIFIQELPMSIPEELSYKHQPEHLQDLDERTSRGFQQDLHKILSQGPVQDHARTSYRISPGFFPDLLTRNCIIRHTDRHARTVQRIPQDPHKRTCCCPRGSYKILMQNFLRASQKGFHTKTSNICHLQDLHAKTF